MHGCKLRVSSVSIKDQDHGCRLKSDKLKNLFSPQQKLKKQWKRVAHDVEETSTQVLSFHYPPDCSTLMSHCIKFIISYCRSIFLQCLAALPKKDQCYQNSNYISTKRTQASDLGEREGVIVKFGKKVIADKLQWSCVQTMPNVFQWHSQINVSGLSP